MPAQDIVEAVNGNESEGVEFAKGMTDAPELPSYDDLPPVPNMPHGCTWGLWDSKGHRDEMGTLNLLTPSTILAAKEEIQYGLSVAINWSLDNCETPHSNRRKPNHRIIPLLDWVGHDDEIEMNTQSGSQWDGFREHSFAHTVLDSRLNIGFWKGTGLINHQKHTITAYHILTSPMQMHQYEMELIVRDLLRVVENVLTCVDLEWSKRGGIVGRGVLLDYSRWAEKQGIKYSPIERHSISEKDLEAVAAWQGTTLRQGDILLIRSGFVKWYKESSPEARRSGTVDGSSWAGVEGTKDSVAWLWNKHFSCVGGDANVFEAWPAKDETYSGFNIALELYICDDKIPLTISRTA